jgi:hypothetical protein
VAPGLKELKSEPRSDDDDHYGCSQPMDCDNAEPDVNNCEVNVKEPIINMPEVVIKEPLQRLINKRTKKHSKSGYRQRTKPTAYSVGFKRTASPDYNAELLGKDQTVPRYRPAEYECLVCDKKFSYFDAIQQHRKIRICRSWKLEKHWRDCAFCKKKINSTSISYEEHLSLQHPEYKPQKCIECSATFLNHFELKDHLDVHLYGKDNQCLGCSKYFRKLLTSCLVS